MPAERPWEYLCLDAIRSRVDGEYWVQLPGRRERLAEGEVLRRLGREGWELVGVVPTRWDGEGTDHRLYLLRPFGPDGGR